MRYRRRSNLNLATALFRKQALMLNVYPFIAASEHF